MAFTWSRGVQAAQSYEFGFIRLVALTAGQTIVRNRFRWGFYADTTPLVDLLFVSENVMSFGLVTTIGDGTEAVPDARANSGDIDPPAQRWLYWETRAPIVTTLSQADGLVTWRDSGSTELTESRGMVKAPTMPGGSTLNLWASWSAPFAWDSSGSAQLWFGWEVLVKV